METFITVCFVLYILKLCLRTLYVLNSNGIDRLERIPLWVDVFAIFVAIGMGTWAGFLLFT